MSELISVRSVAASAASLHCSAASAGAAFARSTVGGLAFGAIAFNDLIRRSLTSSRKLSVPILPLSLFMVTPSAQWAQRPRRFPEHQMQL
jgi:hypothetical protein